MALMLKYWARRKFCADATTILKLNDDCLSEVFKHLDLQSLCAVADVCNRFRQNAKVCFEHSETKELKYNFSKGDPVSKLILKMAKILRIELLLVTLFEMKAVKNCY